jgi:outer membrane biosynthesis protein TonB
VRQTELSPALTASFLLHAAVFAALIVAWRYAPDLKVGSAVPVTIVSSVPDADVRPAEQAPVEQAAATEQPVPDAPPQSAPPQAAPAPAPAPQPTPSKRTPALKPAPTPATASKAKPEKSLDLDALAASLSKASRTAKPSSAVKGAARPETAQQARTTAGAGLSALAMNGLQAELERRWNPNCEVEGGGDVQILVRFAIGAGGAVAGQVKSQIRGGATAVSQAAAERAVRAVYAASPFRNLPPQSYGQSISVTFDAKKACE